MRRLLPLPCLVLILAGATPCLAADPYEAIDRHAIRSSIAVEESIDDLVKYLMKPATNDRQKARAIYRWVTERIEYDAVGFAKGEFGDDSAEGVYKNRKCVCAGYANLFEDLCRRAGLEVVTIHGFAKGYGYKAGDRVKEEHGHAWNAIKLDGKWHLCDSTWGAGYIRDKTYVKRFTEYFFLTPPEQMIFSHFPEEEKWQLLEKPMTLETFEKQPYVDLYLFRLGLPASDIHKKLEDKSFRGFVKLYDVPGDVKVTVEAAPVEKHLKATKKYRFRIQSPDAAAIVVMTGEGQKYALGKKGEVFEGTATIPKATRTISLSVAYRQQPKSFLSILEYEVEP